MVWQLRPVCEGKFTGRFPEPSATSAFAEGFRCCRGSCPAAPCAFLGPGSRRGLREEAGKLLPTGDTVASCLTEVLPRPITPTTVRKFQNNNPAPDVERIFYSRADDPDIAAHLTHGIESGSSLSISLENCSDVSAGELINPPKTFEEVDKESREEHDLYIVSHNVYYVHHGEAKPKTDRQQKKETTMCPSFEHIAETLNVPPGHTFGMLLCPDEYDKVGDLLHCRVPCEFLHGKDRERAVLSAVWQSLQKANYENFDMLLEAFGHYDKNDDGMIDKGNLWRSCFQLNLNLDDEFLDSLFDCDLNKDALINYVEFANFPNWKDKMAVKEFEEKIITKGKKLHAPVLPEDTKTNDEPLLKQEDLVLKEPRSSEKIPKTLTRSTGHVFANYRTISTQYNAVVGGLPTTCYPVCSIPTIHSDIPASQILCFSDRTNYGDEANAYALLFPSVFSQKGVYESVFKTRPKAEIAQILHNIGVNISDERFEAIRKQACMKYQKEEVCVESIRNVLDEIHVSHRKNSY
ncbi:LOW QUALITY PROTEIN: EF-hand domain-containing family member B [Spheniscus humboldti]